MDDEEDQFFIDEIAAAAASDTGDVGDVGGGGGDFKRKLRFILLRLPSIVLADVLLINSDYLMAELERRFAPVILFGNAFVVYLVAKMFVLSFLAICFLLFTLNIKYTVRLYRIIALVGMPFLFTFLIRHVDSNYHSNSATELDAASSSAGSELLQAALVIAVYSLIVPLTIALYDDFYANFIFDKSNILGRYNSMRNPNNADDLTTLLDSFLNHEASERTASAAATETTTPPPPPVHERPKSRARRYFILAYAALSIALNETFVAAGAAAAARDQNSQVQHERLNIMMLGFLVLLVYDLSTNLDQMLLRFLLQLRCLCRYVSQYGLNNLFTFNWFYRLRVPFLLRLYFFLKCIVFSVHFLFVYEYYFNLNKRLISESQPENFSLASFIYSTFKQLLGESPEQHSTTAGLETTTTITREQPALGRFAGDIGSPWDYFVLKYNLVDWFPSAAAAAKLEHVAESEHLTTASLHDVFYLYLRVLILNLSQTLISIAATTSILSLQFYWCGKLVSRITTPQEKDANANAHGRGRANPRRRAPPLNPAAAAAAAEHQQNEQFNQNDLLNVGDVAAILFFLLSIQSGLSSLNGHIRVEKFFKNYTLLFIAILHYFHTTLDAQLMSLSASSKPNWKSKKHLRVLSVCLALFLLPFGIVYLLWSRFATSTWLLAATAFNIELVVKTSVTLLIYTLFMVDSKRITNACEKLLKKTPSPSPSTSASASASSAERIDELSDNLDDFIYVVKAFGHVTEFLVALFLFFNGAYILLFESYGAVRAIMMSIHSYFHIWCQAKRGWSAFKKRRTAIAKLKRLVIFNKDSFRQFKLKQLVLKPSSPTNASTVEVEATASSLLDEGDGQRLERDYEAHTHELCAICYCELNAHETRITSCNHFFHSICLRKWLYLQDTCPMCHQLVYATPKPTSAAAVVTQPPPQRQQPQPVDARGHDNN